MNILLIAGHGAGDPGAVGNGHQEQERTRAIVRELAGRIHGATVDVYPMDHNAVKDGRAGAFQRDFSRYQYICEIHLNASDNATASGSMVYIDQTEKGHSVEDKILANMYALGFKKAWDGVVVTQRQFKTGLLVQNAARRAGASHTLVETCFITNAADLARLNANLGAVAQAIADGIMDGFGLRGKTDPAPTFQPYMVKVDVAKIYDHCLNIRQQPSASSAITGVITETMSLTIVDEQAGDNGVRWGKLKSGAGWINLHYTERR